MYWGDVAEVTLQGKFKSPGPCVLCSAVCAVEKRVSSCHAVLFYWFFIVTELLWLGGQNTRTCSLDLERLHHSIDDMGGEIKREAAKLLFGLGFLPMLRVLGSPCLGMCCSLFLNKKLKLTKLISSLFFPHVLPQKHLFFNTWFWFTALVGGVEQMLCVTCLHNTSSCGTLVNRKEQLKFKTLPILVLCDVALFIFLFVCLFWYFNQGTCSTRPHLQI